MGYFLTFIAGGVVGIMTLSLFVASGKDSELERKYLDDGK